jgi:hypothetical protein
MREARAEAERESQPTRRNRPVNSVAEPWPEDPAFSESAPPPTADEAETSRPFGNIFPGTCWQGADSEEPNGMWDAMEDSPDCRTFPSMEAWRQDPGGEAAWEEQLEWGKRNPYNPNQGSSGSHSLPWKIDKAMSSGRLNI